MAERDKEHGQQQKRPKRIKVRLRGGMRVNYLLSAET